MFKSIQQIRRAHTGYWFQPETMRFFGTQIHGPLIGGRYFVTSEDNFDRTARLFSVRYVHDNADIDTVGEFNSYETYEAALAAAKTANAHGIAPRP